MINLGKLKEIKDLRKVWPHEALDFTPWLAEEDNLTLLADAVGLAITVDETESGVGDFNVDIYARTGGLREMLTAALSRNWFSMGFLKFERRLDADMPLFFGKVK